MGKSVALKCTYNDGGEGMLVGFRGTCSLDNIRRNIENERVWCSHRDCKCRQFYDQGMKETKPKNPCYESRLFMEWRYGSGTKHSGPNEGKPIHMRQVEEGKFAVLTTRFPGEREEKRRIIGLFQIGSVDETRETMIYAAEKGRIRLPIEEARELYFWAYYSNQYGGPSWKTHLFRYLEDSQVHRILTDLVATVREEETRSQVKYLLKNSFRKSEIPPATGPMKHKSAERQKTMHKTRKYGSGGEGEKHKELKLWIACHPEFLGSNDVTNVEVEHTYLSGDSADLVISHNDGKYTVVEVETTDPMPGAHQAIKYRSLLCAEKMLELGTERVRAVLVAWSIPDEVRNFCNKYGIEVKEIRL